VETDPLILYASHALGRSIESKDLIGFAAFWRCKAHHAGFSVPRGWTRRPAFLLPIFFVVEERIYLCGLDIAIDVKVTCGGESGTRIITEVRPEAKIMGDRLFAFF